jgi:caffeoyl-CoA O-methyltransferase
VLYHGTVLAPSNPDQTAVVEFNDYVLTDSRVEAVMIPLADGLTIARKR